MTAPNFLGNLKWGLKWGATIATPFTAITGVSALAGSDTLGSRNSNPSLESLVGFNFLAGLAIGLLVGALRPLSRCKFGQLFLATSVIGLSLALMEYTYVAAGDWQTFDTILVVAGSLVGGPFAAAILWSVRSQRESSGSSEGSET